MRTLVKRARTVGLALVGVLLLSSCDFSVYSIPLPGGPDTGDDPITVTAEFRDVMDLVPQSNVKVNDVDVGRITDIRADGYTAVVDMEIRSDVELPADTFARIRQTSLLGEKFVSLEAPEGSSTAAGALEDDAVIPLERTGRNPEVEEVLGALSLLLNGGGIGQLQVISQELNKALDGREPELRSALRRLNRFATVADDNKEDIVDAIDSLNELSKSANAQTDTINLALDELPSAALSLDRQRDDLVAALTSLDELSDVGVRVIRASKAGTVESLELLEPVLRQLANADDDLAFSISTFLTFPFVDEVVGRDPQVARSIEFGDYVNLDIQLDLRLGSVGDLVDLLCDEVDATVLEALLEAGLPLDALRDILRALCDSAAVDEVQQCLDSIGTDPLEPSELLDCLAGLTGSLPDLVCDAVGALPVPIPLPNCPASGDSPRGSPSGPLDPLLGGGDGARLPDLGGTLGGLLGGGGNGGRGSGGRGSGGGGGGNGGGSGNGGNGNGGGLLGGLFGRTAPNAQVSGAPRAGTPWHRMGDLATLYDGDLTTLLVPPLAAPAPTSEAGAR